jgi:4-alpha-glucanotransferase
MEVGRVRDTLGIEDGYENGSGAWCALPERTRAVFQAALAADVAPAGSAAGAPPPRIVTVGEPAAWPAGTLHLEDGGVLHLTGPPPPDTPLGYHTFEPAAGGAPYRLVLAPPRCWLPENLRTWGFSAQLYALRSRHSWGLGDLGDLERLARWSASLGAGVLIVNPLLADTPVAPQEPSPYHPSSRLFRNPLYLHIEAVPGAAEAGLDLEPLAAAGRALRDRRLDRDAVLALKLRALEILWSRFGGDPAFERWTAAQGAGLGQFATYCVLAERHGRDWRTWPRDLRRPDAPGVARAAAAEPQRLRFHAWLQWLLDVQLERAGRSLALVQDLPIGVSRAGADAWAYQDLLATEVSVGAPPDPFSAGGQNWGFPPFIPQRLRAAGYEPFVRTLRASLRHAGGLRIDHVMGMWRLFWIPAGAGAADGGYVRYPHDDLLALVALESQRAGAFIVGEDLGTVPAGVRQALHERAMLSYRLLWFEDEPPARYPPRALSAVTTHDLPTVAGIWQGGELRLASMHHRDQDVPVLEDMHARLQQASGLAPGAAVENVVLRTYAALAQAPSAILMAALEDSMAVAERPNMPGTPPEIWPSWSLALPHTLEDLEQAELPRRLAAVLKRDA